MSEFNGWSNRQTWNVHMNVRNNAELVYHWLPEIKESSGDVLEFSDGLKEFFENEIGKLSISVLDSIGGWVNGLAEDFISSALEEVNWQELAEYYWKK